MYCHRPVYWKKNLKKTSYQEKDGDWEHHFRGFPGSLYDCKFNIFLSCTVGCGQSKLSEYIASGYLMALTTKMLQQEIRGLNKLSKLLMHIYIYIESKKMFANSINSKQKKQKKPPKKSISPAEANDEGTIFKQTRKKHH